MLDSLLVAYICDNAEKIKESDKCVGVANLPQYYGNEAYQKLSLWFSYSFIALEINTLYRNVCIL